MQRFRTLNVVHVGPVKLSDRHRSPVKLPTALPAACGSAPSMLHVLGILACTGDWDWLSAASLRVTEHHTGWHNAGVRRVARVSARRGMSGENAVHYPIRRPLKSRQALVCLASVC